MSYKISPTSTCFSVLAYMSLQVIFILCQSDSKHRLVDTFFEFSKSNVFLLSLIVHRQHGTYICGIKIGCVKYWYMVFLQKQWCLFQCPSASYQTRLNFETVIFNVGCCLTPVSCFDYLACRDPAIWDFWKVLPSNILAQTKHWILITFNWTLTQALSPWNLERTK